MHFEVYQNSNYLLGGDGSWRWRLRAGNGEIIAQGEAYHNRADCLHAVSLIKQTTIHTPVQML